MAAAARPPSQIGAGTVLRWLLLLLFGLIILPWCGQSSSPGPINSSPPPSAACLALLLANHACLRCCRDVKVQPGPLLRDATPTEADEPQNTATYSREVLYFPCSGVRCQAWLYMPKASSGAKPPVVVAAHGLGACRGGCAVVSSSSACSCSPRRSIHVHSNQPGCCPACVLPACNQPGAQKDFGLAAYGEHFAGQGIASFIFDYR